MEKKKRRSGKRPSSRKRKREAHVNLAFILLSEAYLPETEKIAQAFREFAEPDEDLAGAANGSGKKGSEQVISLRLSTGEESFVVLMPTAVPNQEADDGAEFSLSSFRDDWKLPQHHAHLAVTFRAAADTPPRVALARFTSLLAAVTKVSPAVGVYWGRAGATHDSEFFVSIASEPGIVPRIMLWSGVSIARQKDGRLSLLSLGMEQLQLPDVLLIAGESSASIALETLYDLLAYVAERGEPLGEGDTVGRTPGERLPVHYVKSPVDAKKKVCCIEVP